MSEQTDDALLDVRAWLAAGVGGAFLLICVGTFFLIAGTTGLESWAAGVIGAIVGYWANNLTQIISYYFGSSQSNQANRQTIDRMVQAQGEAAKALAEKVPSPPPVHSAPVDVNVVNEPVGVIVTPPNAASGRRSENMPAVPPANPLGESHGTDQPEEPAADPEPGAEQQPADESVAEPGTDPAVDPLDAEPLNPPRGGDKPPRSL